MMRTVQREIAGRTLSIETGKMAGQANGSVVVRYGDSIVLVTACVAPESREGTDFLPLTIDYEERQYAAGKIPGSFFRREGRPTTNAVLADRLTDRTVRPLFPQGFRQEIQVVITVLSADQENDPDLLAIIGTSAALSISDIPFGGPVSASRIGYQDGEYSINPTFAQLSSSDLDLVIAGTTDAVVMVEAGVVELQEEVVLGAVRRGQEVNRLIIQMQEELVTAVGKPKMAIAPAVDPEELQATESAISEVLNGRLMGAVFSGLEKGGRDELLGNLRQEIRERLGSKVASQAFDGAWENLVKREVRRVLSQEGQRPDGRRPQELRSISCEVGVLPRAHGSGMFTRGQTQVLTIATLASLGQQQRLDGISPEERKRYIHHYNFPPYSVGEVRRLGGPSRRDIGHGALAERALLPMIPSEEDFPYAIRMVSEVMSSNGSTSMASVCASTLSLMDAGVPITAPVAGIAMGLVVDDDGTYTILTDIQGIEDHLGDMDFKVAGTANGINALQMDIKVTGITDAIMAEALEQARQARLVILEKMRASIAASRASLSSYAPRMIRLKIPVEKIGAVIGPGGRTVRAIIERTKATIDVQDDGTVLIGSPSEERAQQAVEAIQALTREVELGAIYTGKVTRIMSFGAFVEILPGKDGLVHIRELADYHVPSVEDVVQVGDEVMVKVIEIDSLGRVNLSRRAAYETSEEGAGSSPSRPDGGQDEGPADSPRPGYPQDRGRGAPGGRPSFPRGGPAGRGAPPSRDPGGGPRPPRPGPPRY